MEKYKINNSSASWIQNPIHLHKKMYETNTFMNSSEPLEKMFDLYRYIDINLPDNYKIIAISDIHSDVNRFIEYLYSFDLILDKTDKITEIKWNPKSKHIALVICGDLIDGRKLFDNKDSRGDNELFLHKVIYNLRLDAIQYNSYIFCTLGNHDFLAFHDLHFHSGNPFLYYDNMEISAKDEYLKFFNSTFSYLLKRNKLIISDIDKIFFGRIFILSRFYLVGFPFFIKINDSLFSHAGFHRTKNVFEYFENNPYNSNDFLNPQFLQRKYLLYFSNIHTYEDFFELCTKKTYEPSFYLFYRFIYNKILKELAPIFSKEKVIEYLNLFINTIDTNSFAENLLFQRRLQKHCTEVNEILLKYNCNLLVVGHCPTFILDVFEFKDQLGIHNANDAHIVTSCNNKLVTVDNAFSSGLAPNKEFFEHLVIFKDKHNNKRFNIIRFKK